MHEKPVSGAIVIMDICMRSLMNDNVKLATLPSIDVVVRPV